MAINEASACGVFPDFPQDDSLLPSRLSRILYPLLDTPDNPLFCPAYAITT
jgi:hypothetical protein